MNEPLVLNLEQERRILTLELKDNDPLEVDLRNPVPGFGSKDYEVLINKPQINRVELAGNKLLQDLFPDGILINCGDSTGYPEPVIQSGIPHEEGV